MNSQYARGFSTGPVVVRLEKGSVESTHRASCALAEMAIERERERVHGN